MTIVDLRLQKINKPGLNHFQTNQRGNKNVIKKNNA